ncbi:MAG: LacI family DNA-binding transcriptional regulator [Pseudomonadota bacterium]
MRRGKVTSIDVARLANVSQSAVSRTFTPGASVSEETKRKVLTAANALGYRPNAIARTLITQRSRIIGVVVAYLDNQFYPLVLEWLSRDLQKRGYHILMFMADTGDADHVLPEILQYQIDGIVMASATLSSGLAQECADAGIPVVLFNRTVPRSPASSVTSDNVDGGRQIARFLVDGGHERIGFIAGDPDSSTNRDREGGFLEEMNRLGQRCWAREVGNYSLAGAVDATERLFGHAERPDAVFVANDHMAIAVMDTLRYKLGLSIPDDVSVVGYDNVPQAHWPSYNLTTVEQPPKPMIEATVDVLMGQIESRSVRRDAIEVPGRLVVRASARIPEGYRVEEENASALELR